MQFSITYLYSVVIGGTENGLGG